MDDLIRAHREEYDQDPEIIAVAPGRINLIGEHTDYNQGFVFPMAIDSYVRAAASRRKDQHLRFFSADFKDRKRASINNLRFKKEDRWANYPKGVISVLLSKGYALGGLNLTFQGEVPLGVGLSSSAALEMSSALAVQQLFRLGLSGIQLATLAQEAENSFVGVHCGIMDQFISSLAEEGHVMLLDTRSLEYRQVPLVTGPVKIMVTNSNVPRTLLDSEYNQRRAECEQCVEILSARKPGNALRDFSASDLRRWRNGTWPISAS
jgi:galactokinase